MSIFKSLAEFFQSLFQSSSPEVKQRQTVRKLENELKLLAPNLYKNSLVQPNFAEGLRILYSNTKKIGDLLGETICSDNLERNHRFEEQLLLTGFDDEAQEIIQRMDYEQRKDGALQATSLLRYFENEHHELEKVVRQMNNPVFMKIDSVLDKIKQLNDICHFNYVSVIRLFDENFRGLENTAPSFQAIPIDLLETALCDLYYVIADMDVTSSLSNAILALYKLYNRNQFDDEKANSLIGNLRKIQSIVKHVFNKEVLLAFIRLSKKDSEYVPQKAVYHGNARKKYAEFLEQRFVVDEKRLKNEIQDETISSKVHDLFGDKQLLPLAGYNADVNNQLKQSTPQSFSFILPMQVLKTFIFFFYEESVKAVVNDIVIEGFFNNPAYKSDFSAIVFTLNEAMERISEFEKKFSRGSKFDEALITGLIHDSHRDATFGVKLREMIDKINKEAKSIIQEETNNINQLHKRLADIVIEAKKPSSELITNLKTLMNSSRNRDKTGLFELQFPLWKVFLEIMKNYVIIGAEKK